MMRATSRHRLTISAFIHERNDQEAAILGRTFGKGGAFIHEREGQEAAVVGGTYQRYTSMSESLRDQLLKSGLAKKLKVEVKPAHATPRTKAVPHAHKIVPPHPPPSSNEVDLARAYALRAKQEHNERARAKREAERIAREKKERKQKLTTLLVDKALNVADAEVPRHFPHGNKIRRVYCTPEQLTRLNSGELAVVQHSGRYLLVTREVGLQAQAIQPEVLVLLCDPDAPAEDDVPADLMW